MTKLKREAIHEARATAFGSVVKWNSPVGESVGESVGASVGASVGESVGDSVGDS